MQSINENKARTELHTFFSGLKNVLVCVAMSPDTFLFENDPNIWNEHILNGV